MKTIIISIGDEVTSGHTINTNAAWMAQRLEPCGVTPDRVVTMRDDIPALARELKQATRDYELILVTGGLGPTHDDVTKPALVKAFKAPLARDTKILRQVKSYFKKIGRVMAPINEGQADVPAGFTPLINNVGTAPGLMLQSGKFILIAMPGVPAEMRHIMQRRVIPIIARRAKGAVLLRRVLRTAGIGESTLSTRLAEMGFTLPGAVALAYLPHFGQVDLRLSAQGSDRRQVKARLQKAARDIRRIAGEYIFGEEDQTLEGAVGQILAQKGLTLACAESCTGGQFAARITAIPGASAYFLAGAVTYSNASKERFANVKPQTLMAHGAVSAEVAAELAEGVRSAAGADIALSSTGVAGPTGGTKEKPVGLIYIGLATAEGTHTQKLQLGMGRKANQARTVNEMLIWLWKTARDWPGQKEKK
ncbi:MAG: competence/damage-inducible protein A [Nitrospinota bacterium]|nr:competence/damage-inducible protein A [Nitrospinota bacterium]